MIRPMLAGKYVEGELELPSMVQPKLDGIRALVTPNGLMSRRGKPIPNAWAQEAFGPKTPLLGLDGELIFGSATAHDCYRKTQSAVSTRDGPPVTFYVYDRWVDDASPYSRRHEDLCRQVDEYGLDHAKILGTATVESRELLADIEEGYVNIGFEGVILRNPNGRYKYGRCRDGDGDLLKLKRFEDSEGVVVGFEEEYSNENEARTNALGYTERSSHAENKVPKGTLGALVLRDDAAWPGITFRVGTGFDAEERAGFWQKRDEILGRTVKYRFFKVGVKDKPRHASFLGFRDEYDT